MIDNKLKEIATKLNIRFPNADFSQNLGFSKGVVSEYLNNKKQLSQNFIEQLENFYNIKYHDFLDVKINSMSNIDNRVEILENTVDSLKERMKMMYDQLLFFQNSWLAEKSANKVEKDKLG